MSISVPSPAVAPKRDRTAISNPYLHKKQQRHFVLYEVLPLVGTIFALALLPFHPIGWVEMGLFTAFWFLTGFGLTVGFHRLFTHRAFKANTAVRVALTIFGDMAARGPMISWTAMHRRHHQRADHEGDMHSPNLHGQGFAARLRGWLHAHCTWMYRHEYPNIVHYVPDLLADKPVVKADRRYHRWIVLGLLLPAALGGLLTESWMGVLTGFLWGGVVRMFVVAQLVSALNSFLHIFGSRPFPMRDNNSNNSVILALLAWGEGWHNNHHAFPHSASFGFRWYELDPGYWVIRLLAAMGWAWDVQLPPPDLITAKMHQLARQAKAQGAA